MWKLNARHIFTEIERQWCQPLEGVCFPGACPPGAGAGDSYCALAVRSIWQGLGSSEAPGRSSGLVGRCFSSSPGGERRFQSQSCEQC